MAIRLMLACFLMCVMTGPAFAQGYGQNVEAVSGLNLVNPARNPKYERASKVLSRHVLDRKNKVIGEVEDVVIGANGTIASLYVDLDRLRLGSLFLGYQQMGIRPVSNAYALSIDDDQLESILPTLLDNIQTAAGDEEETFTVRKIIGATVKTKDGRSFGQVKDVLFNENASRVEALYVNVNSGSVRNKPMAVPFVSSLIIKNKGNGKEIFIDEAMEKAVIEVAKSK